LALAVGSAFAAGQVLSPDETAKRNQTLLNVKQVALSCVLYASDYDDVFPNGTSTAQTQKLTAPYIKNLNLWKTLNPAGGRVLYNTMLAGVHMQSLDSIATTPMLYETNSWRDGRRVVGYADGHVKAEGADRWPEIEKMLKKKFPKVKHIPGR
jgi:prepilin-type processing-associated H-X9-DG protein